MPANDVLHTQQIAAERVHVEGAINKIIFFLYIWSDHSNIPGLFYHSDSVWIIDSVPKPYYFLNVPGLTSLLHHVKFLKVKGHVISTSP